MGTMSEVETPTAVKQHRCCWCWQMIEAGEQYRRYRYWADGDAGTVKLHAECFKAMQDAAADEGADRMDAETARGPTQQEDNHRMRKMREI